MGEFYITYGGKFTPTKLKSLVAQLFVIEFLWCINLFSVWINQIFSVFINFSKIIWAYIFLLVQNLTKFEKKGKKRIIFGHKITNMNQIAFVLYCKFYWIYVLFFDFWFLFIWAFLTILWIFLEKVAKKSKKWLNKIFLLIFEKY